MKLAPLFIVSGPAGVGKTTVVARLLAEGGLPLRQAVSVTTRAPREGEVPGQHYHFWDRERFQEQVEAGAFLEWAMVHGRDFYGTLLSEVDDYRTRGIGVILVIDVQGAAQVRARCPEAVSIFLTAPWEELERRLRGRGTEAEEVVRQRLQTARAELQRAGEYQHAICNLNLEETVARLRELMAGYFTEGERCSTN